jgi:hypothetical protein
VAFRRKGSWYPWALPSLWRTDRQFRPGGNPAIPGSPQQRTDTKALGLPLWKWKALARLPLGIRSHATKENSSFNCPTSARSAPYRFSAINKTKSKNLYWTHFSEATQPPSNQHSGDVAVCADGRVIGIVEAKETYPRSAECPLASRAIFKRPGAAGGSLWGLRRFKCLGSEGKLPNLKKKSHSSR